MTQPFLTFQSDEQIKNKAESFSLNVWRTDSIINQEKLSLVAKLQDCFFYGS